MPVTLSTFNAAIGEIKLRYQEPYVTEGLNAAKAVVVPRGTHRGFRLATNVAPLTLTFVADPTWNDHVAQYLTNDANDPLGYGHTLTIRRVGGNFTSTLAASTSYVIALYATYSVGNPTTAVINAYTLAEYNALPAIQRTELVVLGFVTTPASGAIPAGNITHIARTFAGNELGQDALSFTKLNDDPAFTQIGLTSAQNVNNLFSTSWFVGDFGTGVTFNWTTGDPDPTGNANGQQMTMSVGGAGTFAWVMEPPPMPISVQQGQILRIRIDLKVLAVPSGSPLMSVSPIFTDITGSPIPVVAIPISVTAVDSSYRTIDVTFAAPQGAVFLNQIRLLAGGMEYAGAGNVLRVGAFQAFLETGGPVNQGDGGQRESRLTKPFIRFTNPVTGIPLPKNPLIINIADDFLLVARADGQLDATHLPPGFAAQGTITAGLGLAAAGLPDIARILTDADTGAVTDTYSLLWSTPNVTTNQFAVWAHGNGVDLAIAITFNAFWTQSTQLWSGNYFSYRLYIGSFGILLQRSPRTFSGGAGTWTDEQWYTTTAINGDFSLSPGVPQGLQYFLGLIDSAQNAANSRLRMQSHNQGGIPRRTLLLESGNYALGVGSHPTNVRVYAAELSANNVSLEIVQGAYWNPGGSQWVKDGLGTYNVQRLVIGEGDVTFGHESTNVTAFGDSSWVTWSGGNGTCKCFGYVISDTDNAPGGGYAFWNNWGGYNVLDASVSSTTYIQITFSQNISTMDTFDAHHGASYVVNSYAYLHNAPQYSWQVMPVLTLNNLMWLQTESVFGGIINPQGRSYSGTSDLYILFSVHAPP